ncbi:MAG: ATP-binding protein [Clostridia bacterium]|nr:ATP-binding protein [Clostridia bacterium]
MTDNIISTDAGSPSTITPDIDSLKNKLSQASLLVDDIVRKNYLRSLSELEIVPLPPEMKNISKIRLFRVTEMVYQKKEYSTYKFSSVFSAVQNLNCGVFIIADSNGEKTDFYMGVRSLDDKHSTKSLRDTLKNALTGHFPGVKTLDYLDEEAEKVLSDIPFKSIASVSCIAQNKDKDYKDNEKFIQGLEKFATAMQGQKYTAVILAQSVSGNLLEEKRNAYEMIYTQLSPFASMQISYGKNTAVSISDALSKGKTKSISYSENSSRQKGHSTNTSTATSETVAQQDNKGAVMKSIGSAALGIASILTAPLTGGLSIAAAAAISVGQVGLNAYTPKTQSIGRSHTTGSSESLSYSKGETYGTGSSESSTTTQTKGTTNTVSDNTQLTMKNKTLINTLEKIDLQLKRIDECENVGMWECAAYFLSDTQETAEMAAGTYKALMKGENSGIETSAINLWNRSRRSALPVLHEYITNFIHPVFMYNSQIRNVPVTAASLVSSNEMAIMMGLPRKSVCGFPVIEHADFGKEIVSYTGTDNGRKFIIGNVYSMGKTTGTDIQLNCESLTMHTFVTGSTGSGKSNTVYEMLNQMRMMYNIPFLVIEPAKGEYKNVFGNFPDVKVYGTNPKKTALLKLNPFRFPSDIHVLEHLDRLVEIFNVCWPMYAAMPAILKDAAERAYIECGWDLTASENPKGEIYPNFSDILEKISEVIGESKYSSDSKGDYAGALLTRVRSLTNGLNGMIFCSEDIPDSDLFDKNVIADLSRIGSVETKSLIMGILVMKLNEHRISTGMSNQPLKHITVLEEAHNLLKRVSTEQISESSNILGKSVELLSNSIAEMRTYGEGFIIADQSPSALDMSVIRNTNTKIILRLPDKNDRELVGGSAGLTDEQTDELSKLKCGTAVIYQNDWVEPVLVQINRCGISERPYSFIDITKKEPLGNDLPIVTQAVNLLLNGRVNENLNFDVYLLEKNIHKLSLSRRNEEFLLGQISEYQSAGKLHIWQDECFVQLSKKITDILGMRSRVENCVLKASDNDELTKMLKEITKQIVPLVSDDTLLTLLQCFMRDMSTSSDESEIKLRIYSSWFNDILKRRN